MLLVASTSVALSPSSSVTMDRRAVLVGSGVLAAAPRAAASKSAPAPLAPDTLCLCVAAYDTAGDFDAWLRRHDTRQPRPACLRRLACRCGRDDSALVVSLLRADALPDARLLHAEAAHAHFARLSVFRQADSAQPRRFLSVAPTADALPLRRGAGIMFGAHGLTVGFELWRKQFVSESADLEHADMGVTGSFAGELLPGCTDAPLPGPAVLHATRSPEDAAALAAQLSVEGDPRVKQAMELGVIRPPLYAVAATVERDDRGEGLAS